MNQVMKNNKFKGKFISIKEIMVPYYDWHGDKQYIRRNPVRFGFSASNGTLLYVKPSCGSYTNIPDHGFGHGPNVILEMVSKMELSVGQHVIYDNYFGTIPLLKELAQKDIACTTTLHEDRLGGAPVIAKQQMNKKVRVSMEENLQIMCHL